MKSMQVSHRFYIILVTVLFTACGNTLSAEKYIQYAEDGASGLRITRTMNDVSFTAQYKPLDLLLAKRMRSQAEPDMNPGKYQAGADSLLRFDFYIVTAEGAEHPYRYQVAGATAMQERRFYYEFGEVANAFYIEQAGGKKVYPFACRAEQNGTMTNTLVLECMFDAPLPKKELMLCFEDRIFGKGIIKFRFDTEKLKNLPRLKTNS